MPLLQERPTDPTPDGNLLLDGRWTYQWNAENQLSRMETRGDLPTSVQRLRLDFTYDYIGRRTRKVVSVYTPPPPGDDEQDEGSGGDTGTWDADYEVRYVWDGWLLLAELDGEDNVLRSYAWGPDLSGTIGGAGGIGGLAFQTDHSGSATYLCLHDGRGDVTSLRATDGSEAAAYRYGPFGMTLTSEGEYRGSNPFRFSSKYADPESGLYYFGYRYYNAGSGRWLSRDPIEEEGGFNVYSYALNAPTDVLDALGQRPLEVAFVAFINGVRRGQWLIEPGPPAPPRRTPRGVQRGVYQYKTDLRDFGQFNFSYTQPNARLASLGGIDSTRIGDPDLRNGDGFWGLSVAGDSTRRTAHQLPGEPPVFGVEESRRASVRNPDPRIPFRLFRSACVTELEFVPRSTYPFNALSPSINYGVVFRFEVVRPGWVTITMRGWHNRFPDYEAYMDGIFTWSWYSPSTGPSMRNLNTTRNIRGRPGISVEAPTPPNCGCS